MNIRGVQTILFAAAVLASAAKAQQTDLPQAQVFHAGATVRLQVIFQSCGRPRRDDQLACIFYGSGMKIYATKDADTHVATFRRLVDAAPGTPMVAEGRIVRSFGGTAEIRMTAISGRVPGPQDRVLQRLQGSWVAELDINDEFTIRGSEREGYYAGLSVLTESITVQDSCNGASGRPPYLYAFDQEGGVGLCYEVISASEDELLLSYLPRGDRLRYLRKR